LIKDRRRLRNAAPDNTFVNPANLSSYFSKDYKKTFDSVRHESAAQPTDGTPIVASDGASLLELKQLPVQMGPGQRRNYLGRQDKGL
jgi:hypothetical protein